MSVRSAPSAPLEHLEQLVALCPIAIANTDARHRIRYCNTAFEKLFGYRASEALGKKLELLVGLERDRGLAAAFHRARNGQHIHLTARAHRKDQRTVEVEFYRAGFWALFQDITERHEMEQQLRVSVEDAEAMLSRVTRAMIEAQESERIHIARELHDDVGQRLVLWQLVMDRLRRDLRDAPGDISARMDELRQQAKSISEDLQALSRELHSPALSLLSVDKALKRLCDEMSTRFGIQVEFTSRHVSISVQPETSLCLFRVLQETLTNVAKAGEARRVTVTLTATSGTIHLKIRDVGSAFEERIAGLGLLQMRERVAMVKGTLSIASPREGGTEIDVRVPLGKNADSRT
jgi:PAS domain S-box-containing protein